MDYKIEVSEDAHKDIDEIVGYIAQALKNTTAAIEFLNDVENSYRLLIDNPRLFSLCNDEGLQEKGYRKVVIKSYLILYRIDDKQGKVFIVRVVYGARDYAKLL